MQAPDTNNETIAKMFEYFTKVTQLSDYDYRVQKDGRQFEMRVYADGLIALPSTNPVPYKDMTFDTWAEFQYYLDI